jgi:chemotaxis family two-component system response regulator Rcp1
MGNLRSINVLMAEDSLGDIRLTEEAIKEGKLNIELHTVMNGADAMAYLRKEGRYSNVVTPDLVILDLNMPIKDGRQVLVEIKEDPKFKMIPVVILTTSNAEDDIVNAYSHYVNSYITKPLDLNKFIEILKNIENFWGKTVTLPAKE